MSHVSTDGEAVDISLPLARRKVAREHRERRRLAGSVDAKEAETFGARDRERQVDHRHLPYKETREYVRRVKILYRRYRSTGS